MIIDNKFRRCRRCRCCRCDDCSSRVVVTIVADDDDDDDNDDNVVVVMSSFHTSADRFNIMILLSWRWRQRSLFVRNMTGRVDDDVLVFLHNKVEKGERKREMFLWRSPNYGNSRALVYSYCTKYQIIILIFPPLYIYIYILKIIRGNCNNTNSELSTIGMSLIRK